MVKAWVDTVSPVYSDLPDKLCCKLMCGTAVTTLFFGSVVTGGQDLLGAYKNVEKSCTEICKMQARSSHGVQYLRLCWNVVWVECDSRCNGKEEVGLA